MHTTPWKTACMVLAIAAAGAAMAQASRQSALGDPPEKAGQYRKKTVDLETGKGKLADQGVVLYRFSQRGVSTIGTRALNLPRRDSETTYQAISDGLLGMRVGGVRSVTIFGIGAAPAGMPFNSWNNNLMLELLDVAPTEGALRPKSEFEAGNTAADADTGKFFAGCEVIQKTGKTAGDQIRGTCLGATFTDAGASAATPCVVNYKASAKLWNVYNCNMDGSLIGTAYFREDNGRLADVADMGSGSATAGIPNELQAASGGSANNPVSSQIQNLPNNASRPGYAADSRECEAYTRRELSPRGLESLGGFGPRNYVFTNCMSEKYKLANNKFVRPQKEEQQARTNAEAQRVVAVAAQQAASARAEVSARYPALVAAARARSKTDPVVLGIVLGEQWHGVQDVNDCRIAHWQANSAIPFCLYEDKDFKIPQAERWDTCVRMADTKFDTSWIISAQGKPSREVEGWGAAIVAFGLAADEARRCFVDVHVLADGTVGLVSTVTSLRAKDVDTLVGQLKSKYGNGFSVTKQSWTGGHTTAVLQWKLPGLNVIYTEQAENKGGYAFEGGQLKISTPAWDAMIANETQKNFKPAF